MVSGSGVLCRDGGVERIYHDLSSSSAGSICISEPNISEWSFNDTSPSGGAASVMLSSIESILN